MLIKTKIEYLNEIILLISDTELDDVLSSTVTDIIEND